MFFPWKEEEGGCTTNYDGVEKKSKNNY